MTADKDHVVSGLIAKRAELAGVIDQLQHRRGEVEKIGSGRGTRWRRASKILSAKAILE
jgi:hypothetical protein